MSKNNILHDLESKFNIVIIGLIKQITTYEKDRKIKLMSGIAKKMILKNPKEPIAYFLLHIYKNDEYRQNILDENDKFFMNYNTDNTDNNSMIDNIFKFQSIWVKIDDNTKAYIKKAMKTLVLISQKYILSL